MTDKNEAETIADLAVKAGAGTIVKDDNRAWLMVPPNFRAEEITDPHGLKPHRPAYVRQKVTLQTQDSLADYINRFKTPATMLFANIASSQIVGALDYHEPSGDSGGEPGKADHVVHRAALGLPYSEEWRLWTGISGKLMGQLEFARFIEENAPDVSTPPAAELIETVRDLQAHRKVNFTKAVRTSSNNENFEWTDETETRARNGGVELPTRFELAFPVYFGEPMTPLYAFLRWELGEGTLRLGIQLHRAEHVRQAEFKRIVTAIVERTGCPVVYGAIGGEDKTE